MQPQRESKVKGVGEAVVAEAGEGRRGLGENPEWDMNLQRRTMKGVMHGYSRFARRYA